jgi:PAS domain S-box-containing protein
MKKTKHHSTKFIDIILDSIADGVFTIDKNWRITSFNQAAEKITGISKEKAIGQYCFNVFRTNICQKDCALKSTMESRKQIINKPVNIITATGKQIPISISTAILKDKEGKIIGGVETFRDLSIIEELRKELYEKYTFEDIISKNHRIIKIFNILPDISESDSTVLIQGPTGSGKELFAKAIHSLSLRKNKPFVAVNCSALPETLMESELFGYLKGAFTNANKDKPGRFALAESGTIFLDEVGDIPLVIQVKLLRVIQEKEYEPLGSTKLVKANVRIIAATNKDLVDLISCGEFRQDLYFRLNVVKVEIPPLAQRKEDIPLLVVHFLNRFNYKMNKQILGVKDEVMELLLRYEYLGNVRELENIVEHCVVLCRDNYIDVKHLPEDFLERVKQRITPKSMKEEFNKSESKILEETLVRNLGNRAKTAEELGIDRTTLWRKMKKYGINISSR